MKQNIFCFVLNERKSASMLSDGLAIPFNRSIRYIGYNIEQGIITAEKIYYRPDPYRDNSTDPPLITEMIDSIKGIRLTSVENASLNVGVSKYDFLISDNRGWLKTAYFLKKHASYYRPILANLMGMVSWLRFQYTSVGIRFKSNRDEEIELYFRKKNQKKVRPSVIARRILTRSQYNECSNWIHLFYENNGWIRSAGVSFNRTRILFKLYLETSDEKLKYKVLSHFCGTSNYTAFKEILDYTDSMNLLFKGMGLVINKEMNTLRFNFYYTQR